MTENSISQTSLVCNKIKKILAKRIVLFLFSVKYWYSKIKKINTITIIFLRFCNSSKFQGKNESPITAHDNLWPKNK